MVSSKWENFKKNYPDLYRHPTKQDSISFKDCRYVEFKTKNDELFCELKIYEGSGSGMEEFRCSYLFKIEVIMEMSI